MFAGFSNQNLIFCDLYHYPNNIRPIISTTNIIKCLCPIITTLLQEQNFPNIEKAKRYITITAHEVIINGGELLPNLSIICKPVHII